MLEAKNIHVLINDKSLLNDVSLAVAPGEMVVLIGANGAGKTTLLNVLAGDRSPASGKVHLDEKPLSAYCPRTMARRRAVMPQHSPLSFTFSVLEVVEMGRAPHIEQCSVEHNRRITNQAMELTDIIHLSDRDYTTLSGGEKQRVHLARVLSQIWEPEPFRERYLLLDEPTSSLDIHHQYEMLGHLKSIRQDTLGIVLIAHDLNLAALFADRIIVLKDGRMIASGHPNEVYTEEILSNAFSLSAHIGQHPDVNRPYVIPKQDTVLQKTPIHKQKKSEALK